MIAVPLTACYDPRESYSPSLGASFGATIRVSEVWSPASMAGAHTPRCNSQVPVWPVEGGPDDTGNDQDRTLRVGGKHPSTEERFKVIQDLGSTVRHRASLHSIRNRNAGAGLSTYRDPVGVHSIRCSFTANCAKIQRSSQSAVQPERSGGRINVATDNSRKTNV